MTPQTPPQKELGGGVAAVDLGNRGERSPGRKPRGEKPGREGGRSRKSKRKREAVGKTGREGRKLQPEAGSSGQNCDGEIDETNLCGRAILTEVRLPPPKPSTATKFSTSKTSFRGTENIRRFADTSQHGQTGCQRDIMLRE